MPGMGKPGNQQAWIYSKAADIWSAGSSGGTSTPVYAGVVTGQSTSSGTYADLTTPGPSVTVTVGSSGNVIVMWGCAASSSSGYNARMSFALSGTNTIAANDTNAIIVASSYSAMYSTVSRMIVLTGLNPGVTTFTAKYRTDSGASWGFSLRDIMVTPL
jgi:hypothetical protein